MGKSIIVKGLLGLALITGATGCSKKVFEGKINEAQVTYVEDKWPSSSFSFGNENSMTFKLGDTTYTFIDDLDETNIYSEGRKVNGFSKDKLDRIVVENSKGTSSYDIRDLMYGGNNDDYAQKLFKHGNQIYCLVRESIVLRNQIEDLKDL